MCTNLCTLVDNPPPAAWFRVLWSGGNAKLNRSPVYTIANFKQHFVSSLTRFNFPDIAFKINSVYLLWEGLWFLLFCCPVVEILIFQLPYRFFKNSS